MGGRVVEPEFSLASSGRGTAVAFEPPQPEWAPGGSRRPRRGVGRGVLCARHRILDARVTPTPWWWARSPSFWRARDSASGMSWSPESEDTHGRPLSTPSAHVVGQRAGGRQRFPTSWHLSTSATWSRASRRCAGSWCALLRAHGLEPQPSDANWVLVAAPRLRADLATHGIVVRDCTSFGMPDVVRIAVPDADRVSSGWSRPCPWSINQPSSGKAHHDQSELPRSLPHDRPGRRRVPRRPRPSSRPG